MKLVLCLLSPLRALWISWVQSYISIDSPTPVTPVGSLIQIYQIDDLWRSWALPAHEPRYPQQQSFRSCHVHHLLPARRFCCPGFVTFVPASNCRLYDSCNTKAGFSFSARESSGPHWRLVKMLSFFSRQIFAGMTAGWNFVAFCRPWCSMIP